MFNYYADPTAGKGWDAHIKKTDLPFAVTVFDKSPLNKVLEQGAAGVTWQPSATPGLGRTVKTTYGTNTIALNEVVRLWSLIASGATGLVDYPAGSLYRITVRDENTINTTFRTGAVDEYTDIEGRLVLKRVWESESKALNTYYIYDDLGNLRYVIPPAVTVNNFSELPAGVNFADFENYIYAYRYDDKRRLIEKKLPGKGWEYLVYNRNDQVVLTQDSIQRAGGKWSYTKYDAFGRVVSTGIYTNTTTNQTTRKQVQALADAVTAQWESRIAKAYTNTAFPSIASQLAEYTVKYYDDYSFKDAGILSASSGLDSTRMIKGLLTGTKVAKDDATLPLLTVHYYDKRAQLVETVSQNHIGGTDRMTNTYSFVGELLTSIRIHTPATGAATIITTTNTYDHVGRLVETRKRIGTQTEIVQSQLAYNEIGQLKQKNLHGSGAAAVQEIAYAYNERGWMTGINDPNGITDRRRFGMTLQYANNPRAYNGNIGSVQWNTKVSTSVPTTQTPVQSYAYTYDALNRLKKAAYSGVTTKANHYNEELAYDVMGNIDTLRRSNGATGWHNHFKYTYSGHRLIGVNDAGTAKRHNSFTYDVNGNAISNTRLSITKIDYNYLNLPSRLTKGAEVLAYTYDATGKKLTKQLGTAAATHYVDGIQYKGGAIEFIQTEEGRILPNGSSYIYEYFLKDDLGNTRAIVDHTGAVKQVQDYYAFGMEMNPGNAYSSGHLNLYKYNGKEKQTELGLDQMDHGARFYDAEIGRWNVIDPLSEKYSSLTPYNYALNNPIFYIDPDGKEPTPKEAAIMSKHVYNDANDPTILIGGWKVSNIGRGLTLLDEKSGFKSAVYERQVGNSVEYVYATAGTENLADWKNNAAQLAGLSKQYELSKQNAASIKERLVDAELTYTGHSLGGGMAEANSRLTGDKGITFNGAGLSEFTSDKKGRANIVSYIMTTDPLNVVQMGGKISGGWSPLIQIAGGERRWLQPRSINGVINGHSINAPIESLSKPTILNQWHNSFINQIRNSIVPKF